MEPDEVVAAIWTWLVRDKPPLGDAAPWHPAHCVLTKGWMSVANDTAAVSQAAPVPYRVW